MIYTKLISGLGNQLFQYAVARQLSLLRQTDLKLDTSFFDTQSLRGYKLHHYNIVATPATEAELSQLLRGYRSPSWSGKLYRRFDRLLPKARRRYFKEGAWWGYEPDLYRAGPTVYLDGYWQHQAYFAQLSPTILAELTLRESLTGPAAQLAADMQQAPASVAVHIRRGDYLTDRAAADLMGVLPLTYYRQAMQRLREQLGNPVFYFFSDDLQWVREQLAAEPGPLHFVDIAGGQQDYVELDLMSQCQHNIIANSSFSWWGAFLNRNPAKIVVAPRQWVRPPEVNARIHVQMPGWVLL